MDLEQVYREQYRPLVAFLARRLGDHGRAEELAQEAFVRAIRHEPRNPRAWLYRVARNLARDDGRKRTVRQRHLRLVQAERMAEPVSDPEPEAELERKERRARARRALAALGERDRKALMMKEDGASYPEIAGELGLALGSVGTTLSRARKRLAEAWEREGDRDDVAR